MKRQCSLAEIKMRTIRQVQYGIAVLSLLEILSIRLEILALFRDFQKSFKICKMKYFRFFCKSFFFGGGISRTFLMSVRFHATPAQFPTEKVNSFNTKFQTGCLLLRSFKANMLRLFIEIFQSFGSGTALI